MHTRAAGARRTSGSQGPGSRSHSQLPSLWRNPVATPTPRPSGFQQQQLGVRQPRLRSPRTAPSPMRPPHQAKELEGFTTRETDVLGASPASFPRVRRAPVTSVASSPPFHPSESKPQARSPRVRVPDSPRVSPVGLRLSCPRGAQDQPQVGEVCAPSSQPATHREEGALRRRPESAPAASRAVHVPEPRLRALARC